MSGTVLCGVYGNYCKESGIFVGGGEDVEMSYIVGSAEGITESLIDGLVKVNTSLADAMRKASGETKKKLRIAADSLARLNEDIMRRVNNSGRRVAELFAENMLNSLHSSYKGEFVGGSDYSAIHQHSQYILATHEFVGGAASEITDAAKVRIKVFEHYLEMLERLNSAASGDKSKAELKHVIREQSEFIKKAIIEFKRIASLLGASSDISKKLEELSRSGKIDEIKKMLKEKSVNDELIKGYLQLLRLEGHVAVRAEELSESLKRIGMTRAEFDKLANFDKIESAMNEYEAKIMGKNGKDRIKYIDALERVKEFAKQHVSGEKFEGACPCNDPSEFYPEDSMKGAAEAVPYHGGEFLELERDVELQLKAQVYGEDYDPITRHFVEEQAKILAEMMKAAKTSAMELAAKPVYDDLEILNFLNRLGVFKTMNERELLDTFATRKRDYNSNYIKEAVIHSIGDLIAAAKSIEGKVPSIKNFIKCVEEYKRFLEKYHAESKASSAEYVGGVNCSGIGSSSVYDRFEEESAIPQNLFIGGFMDITMDDVIGTFTRSITLGRMMNGLNLSLKELDGFSLEQDKINADVLSKETIQIAESVNKMISGYKEIETFPIKKNLFATVLTDNMRGQTMLRHAAQAMDKKMRYYQRGLINNPEMAKKLTDLLAHVTVDQAWIADPDFTDLKSLCKFFHVESVAKNKATPATFAAAGVPGVAHPGVAFDTATYKNNSYLQKDLPTPLGFSSAAMLSSHVSTLVAATHDGNFDVNKLERFKYTNPGATDPIPMVNWYGGDHILPMKTTFAKNPAAAGEIRNKVADPDEAAYNGGAGTVLDVKFLSEDKIARNYRDALAHQRKAADSILMLRNLFSIFEHIDAAYRKTSSAADDGVKIGQIYGAVKEYLILTCMYPTVYETETGKFTCGHIALRHFGHEIVVPFEDSDNARSFEKPYQSDIMDQLSNRGISLREYYDGIDVAADAITTDTHPLPRKDKVDYAPYAPKDKGLRKEFDHEKHGFKARYMEHDILLTMMLKSMFAKIMTVLAQFKLLNLDGSNKGEHNNLSYHQLRTIYGGGIMDSDTYVATPDVRPECAELYLRLYYYVNFYRSLFIEENSDPRYIIEQIAALRRIALLPTSASKFGPILKIFFIKGFNVSSRSKGLADISDIDLANYVGECNKLYDAETGTERVRMEKVIKDFIIDVNRRYGLVKTDEFVDLMDKKRDRNYPEESRMRTREEYMNKAEELRGRARFVNLNKPLLDGENAPIGSMNAPSAAKEIGLPYSTSISLITPKKSDFVMTDLMAAVYVFRRKLDRTLKELTEQFEADEANAKHGGVATRISNSLFRHIIYLKTKLASRKNNLERFRVLKEYITSDKEEKIFLVNRDVMLYRDLVVNGANLMYKLYTRIMANVNIFGMDVKFADPLNRGSYLYYLDSVNTDLVGVNRLGKSPQLDFSVFATVADSFLDQTRQFQLMLRSAVDEDCAKRMDKIITLLVNTHRSLFKHDGMLNSIKYDDIKLAPVNDFSEFPHFSFFKNPAGQNSFLIDNRFGFYDYPLTVRDPRSNVVNDLAVPDLEFELLSMRFAPRNIYQLFEYLMVAMYKMFFEQHGVMYGPLMNEFVINSPDTGFSASDKASELGGIEDFDADMPISKKVIALYKTIYRFTTVKKDTLVQNDYTLLPEELKMSMKRLLPVFMFYFKFIVKHSYLQLGMLNDEQIILNNTDKATSDVKVFDKEEPDGAKMLRGAGGIINEATLIEFNNVIYPQLVKSVKDLRSPTAGLPQTCLDLTNIKKGGKVSNYAELDEEKIGLALGSTRNGNSLIPERNPDTIKLQKLLNSMKGIRSVTELREKANKFKEEYERFAEASKLAINPIDFSYEMLDFLDSFIGFTGTDFLSSASRNKITGLIDTAVANSQISKNTTEIVEVLLGEKTEAVIDDAFTPIDVIGKYIQFNTELKKVNNSIGREIIELDDSRSSLGDVGLAKLNAILHNIPESESLVRNFLIYLYEKKGNKFSDTLANGGSGVANTEKFFIGLSIADESAFVNKVSNIINKLRSKNRFATPSLASSNEASEAALELTRIINEKLESREVAIPIENGAGAGKNALDTAFRAVRARAKANNLSTSEILDLGNGGNLAVPNPVTQVQARLILTRIATEDQLLVLNTINGLINALYNVEAKLSDRTVPNYTIDYAALANALVGVYNTDQTDLNGILAAFKTSYDPLVLRLRKQLLKELKDAKNKGDAVKTIEKIYEAANLYSPYSNYMVSEILIALSNTEIVNILDAAGLGVAITDARVFDGKSTALIEQTLTKAADNIGNLYNLNKNTTIEELKAKLTTIIDKGKASPLAQAQAYFADVAIIKATEDLFKKIENPGDATAEIAAFYTALTTAAIAQAAVAANSQEFLTFRGLGFKLLSILNEYTEDYPDIYRKLAKYVTDLEDPAADFSAPAPAAQDVLILQGTSAPDATLGAYLDNFINAGRGFPEIIISLYHDTNITKTYRDNIAILEREPVPAGNLDYLTITVNDMKNERAALEQLPYLTTSFADDLTAHTALMAANSKLVMVFESNLANDGIMVNNLGSHIERLLMYSVLVINDNRSNQLLSSALMNLAMRILSAVTRNDTSIFSAAGVYTDPGNNFIDGVALYISDVLEKVEEEVFKGIDIDGAAAVPTPDNITLKKFLEIKKFIVERWEDTKVITDVLPLAVVFPDVGVTYFDEGKEWSKQFVGGVTSSDFEFIKTIYNFAGTYNVFKDAYKVISSRGARIIAAHDEFFSKNLPEATEEQKKTLMVYALTYFVNDNSDNKDASGKPVRGLKKLRDTLERIYGSIINSAIIGKLVDLDRLNEIKGEFSGKSYVKNKIKFTPGTAIPANALAPKNVGDVNTTILKFGRRADLSGIDAGAGTKNPINKIFYTAGLNNDNCRIRAKNAIKFGTLIYKSLAKVYTEIGETPKYLNFTPYIGEVYELINAEKNISPISVGVDMIPTFINTYIDASTTEANIIKDFDSMKDRKPLGIHSNNINDFNNLLINGRNGMFNGLTIFLHDDKMHNITLNDFPYLKKLLADTTTTDVLQTGFSIPIMEKHIQNFGKLTKYLYELEFKDMANTFPVFNNLDVPKFPFTTTVGNSFLDKGKLRKVEVYNKKIRLQSLANSLPIALSYRGLLNPQGTAAKDVLEILEAYLQRDASEMSTGERYVLPPDEMVPILELGSNTNSTVKYISCNDKIKNYGSLTTRITGIEELIIRNIIDLGIMPININAMMREIPYANTFNNNYTFDILMDWLIVKDEDEDTKATVPATAALEVDRNLAGIVQAKATNRQRYSLKNPLGEVFVATTQETKSLYKHTDTIINSPTSIIAALTINRGANSKTFDAATTGYRFIDLDGDAMNIFTERIVERVDRNGKTLFKAKYGVPYAANSDAILAVNVNDVYRGINRAGAGTYEDRKVIEAYTGLGWQLANVESKDYSLINRLTKYVDKSKIKDVAAIGGGLGTAPGPGNFALTRPAPAALTTKYEVVPKDSYYGTQSIAGLTYGNIHNGVDPDLRNNVIAINIYAEMLHNLYKKKFKDEFEKPSRDHDDTFATGITSLYQSGPLSQD